MIFERKPALLGIAHGSRNPNAAVVTEALLERAGTQLGVEAHAAYLEDFAAPSIPDVAGTLASQGYTEAVAVPLLFTSAYHATEDAPEAIAEAEREHGIRITQADVLGTGTDLAHILAAHLRGNETPTSPEDSPILLLGVGSSRPGANESVQQLGTLLADHTDRPVTVRFATCAPRATDFLKESDTPGTLLPLFTAPGKLLDATRNVAVEAGWQVLPHLGNSLAPLVAKRYLASVSGFSNGI